MAIRIIVETTRFLQLFLKNLEPIKRACYVYRQLGSFTSNMPPRLEKRTVDPVFAIPNRASELGLRPPAYKKLTAPQSILPERRFAIRKPRTQPFVERELVVLFNYAKWLYRHAYMNISLLENCSDMYEHVYTVHHCLFLMEYLIRPLPIKA